MNIAEYMRKHGITDADLDAAAAPYEAGDYSSEGGTVYEGSHLDAVGKRRVTVIYDARDVQAVTVIARSRGVKPAHVYREALSHYLNSQV